MSEVGTKVESLAQAPFMLRLGDGTPVTSVYTSPGWERNERTGVRREGVVKSFNPRFNSNQPTGTLIEINNPKDPQYFIVTSANPGQEIPESVYAQIIPQKKFEELKKQGSPVVTPDNLP